MKIQALYSYFGNTYVQKTNSVAFKSGAISDDEQVGHIVSRDGAEAIKAATLTGDNYSLVKLHEEAVKHLEEYEQLKIDAAQHYQKDCETVSDIIDLAQRASDNRFRNIRDSHRNVVKHFEVRFNKGKILLGTIVETDVPGIDKRKSFFNKGKLERVEEYIGTIKNVIDVDGQKPQKRLEGVVANPDGSTTSEKEIAYIKLPDSPSGAVNFNCYTGVEDYQGKGNKIEKAYTSDQNGRLFHYQEDLFNDMPNQCSGIAREFEYESGMPKYYSKGQFADSSCGFPKKQVNIS